MLRDLREAAELHSAWPARAWPRFPTPICCCPSCIGLSLTASARSPPSALLMIVAAAVTGEVTAKIALACVAAYASHLLLDWLGRSDAAVRHPSCCGRSRRRGSFQAGTSFRPTERRHFFDGWRRCSANLVADRAGDRDSGAGRGALWLVRVKALARLAAEMSRGDHPAQQRTRPVLRDRRSRRAAR